MTLTFDFFCSFRSPYSYLAIDRVFDIYRRYDVDVNVRLVLPYAVLPPERFEKAALPHSMVWLDYLAMDPPRTAEFLGIPFHWPRPDPIVQDMETGAIAAEQPYCFRLVCLGQAAIEAGRGIEFFHAVDHIIWDGTIDGWDQGDHLAEATKRAGLDLASLEEKADANAERYEENAFLNDEALIKIGHWGRPVMVFDGEPFWGQDRVEMFLWRLKQQGLQERA